MGDKSKSLEQLIGRLAKLGSYGITLRVVELTSEYNFKFRVDTIRMLKDEEYNKVVKSLSTVIHNSFRYLGMGEVPKYYIIFTFDNDEYIDKEFELLMKDISDIDFTQADSNDYRIRMKAFGRRQYGYSPRFPNHLNIIADSMDEMDTLLIWFNYEGEKYEYDAFSAVDYRADIEKVIDIISKDLMDYVRNNASKYPLLSLFKNYEALRE